MLVNHLIMSAKAFEVVIPVLQARLERGGTVDPTLVEVLVAVERLRHDHTSMNLSDAEERALTRLLIRNDEVRRGVVAQHQGRALPVDELRRHLEDRVEKILRQSRARAVHANSPSLLLPPTAVGLRLPARRTVSGPPPAVTMTVRYRFT